MNTKKLTLILIVLFTSLAGIQAQISKAPANPKPIEFKQPDGTLLTIFLKGDERMHWAETKDGYTLLSNKKGGYEYAKLDKKKNLVKTGKLAHQEGNRSKKEVLFLSKIKKGLHFSELQQKKANIIRKTNQKSN